MAAFELDQESVSRAGNLTSQLMRDLRIVSREGRQLGEEHNLFSERRYAEQAEGVPIGDVVVQVGQLAAEFALARRWDGEIFCLRLDDGELAPIAISELSGSGFWGNSAEWMEWMNHYGPFPFRHLWREILKRKSLLEEQVTVANVDEAEEAVQRGLNGFLAYRFAGMKKWTEWIRGIGPNFFAGSGTPSGGGPGIPVPPAVGPGGGLQVQVSCVTPGLRIHISPAYFITWVVFGSPTTPVTNYVLPGRYVFAGDGPMLPQRRKDNGIFCIPPDYHLSLTRF